MGGILSNTFANQLEKQLEKQRQMQREMLERQMHMQNMMREKAAAMQYGKMREMLYWQAGLATFASIAVLQNFIRTQSIDRRLLVPFVPAMFVIGYQVDMVYADKMNTIRHFAEQQLVDNPGMFALPNGMITFEEVEARRAQHNEKIEL